MADRDTARVALELDAVEARAAAIRALDRVEGHVRWLREQVERGSPSTVGDAPACTMAVALIAVQRYLSARQALVLLGDDDGGARG